MFRWYQKAEICYAYLSDVEMGPDVEIHPTYAGMPSDFTGSRWFTRGWTLQELIAPKQVVFYSRGWEEIGTKERLCSVLEGTTKIDKGVLLGKDLKSTSVADRMSWAATRTTTRSEDMAYSLLGLFDVNMPLLYGEGQKAFMRLQEEILKTSNDQSLFVWTSNGELLTIEDMKQRRREESFLKGLLAESPSDFANIGGVKVFEDWPGHHGTPPRVHSNCVYIDLPVFSFDSDHDDKRGQTSDDDNDDDEGDFNFYFAALGCYLYDNQTHILGIALVHWGIGQFSGRRDGLVLIPVKRYFNENRRRQPMRSLQVKRETFQPRFQPGSFVLKQMLPMSTGYDDAKLFLYGRAKCYDARRGPITSGLPSDKPQAILLFESTTRQRFAIALFWRSYIPENKEHRRVNRAEVSAKRVPHTAFVYDDYLETLFAGSSSSEEIHSTHWDHSRELIMVLDGTTDLVVCLNLESELPWEPDQNNVSISLRTRDKSVSYGLSLVSKWLHGG
jgi:hypothetical protein